MPIKPKISIIVPVYKAEKYLHRCVDSILAQTFTDFELLLIDDGSPDSSGEICDQYASVDSRVRVFHKPNGGVSSARQCGLDNAQGEYTIHADPDDWVEPDMLQELYAEAKRSNADMVICDYFQDYNGTCKHCRQQIYTHYREDVLRKLLLGELHGACWNKMIRSIYTKKVRFPDRVIRWEDLWVNCEILMQDISIVFLSKAFYHYDLSINTNSIVRLPTLKGVESQISFCDHFDKILDHNRFDNELFRIKSATKELMFYSKLYPSIQVVNKYVEINNRYCKENGNISRIRNIFSLKYSLSLLLGGYTTIAYILMNFTLILKNLKLLYRHA